MTAADSGIRYLRAQDIGEGEITSDDPIYITPKYFASVKRSHIRPGYLLFSIMASIGKSAIVPENFPSATANRAVGILVPRRGDVAISHYLFFLFATDLGKQLYARIKKGGLQQRTNLADVAALEFPLPPSKLRQKLVAEMKTAREACKRGACAADELLASVDQLTCDTLKIPLPPSDNTTCFGIYVGLGPKLEELRRTLGNLYDHRISRHRLDPQHYQPTYRRWLSAMTTTGGASLGALINVSHEQWTPLEIDPGTVIRYIEISGIDTTTGEIVQSDRILAADAPSRARMVVRTGDILVSLTRPHLGAIAEVTPEYHGCVASTGFGVLRGLKRRKDFSVTLDYLWCVLRSAICREQMMRNSTGGNYPAISESGLLGLFIPTRPEELQRELVAEVRSRREKARRLRSEAEATWTAAKQRFEAALLRSLR